MEEVQLVQPLQEPSENEVEANSRALPMCDQGSATKSCAKNVLSLSEFTGSVLHDAEKIGKWEQKVERSVIRHIKRALGFKNPTGHDAACAAFGVGVNLVLKDSPFGVTNAAGVAAALGCAALFNS